MRPTDSLLDISSIRTRLFCCATILIAPLIVGCAANQEQTQQTKQPTYVEVPTRQDNTQQAATDGPVANWFAVSNPHGRGQWNRHGYKDTTDEGETADAPPEFLASASPDEIEAYFKFRLPTRMDYSVHGNTVTQTVTGEMSGTQSNSPASTPSTNPQTTGTSTGGASDQRQTPTASTAIDVPVAAAPGASATGGTPNASAAAPEGTSTGGTNTNTPSSTGNNTTPEVASGPGPKLAETAISTVKSSPEFRQQLRDALASGAISSDPMVAIMQRWMAADSVFAGRVLAELAKPEPATQPTQGGGGSGPNDQG